MIPFIYGSQAKRINRGLELDTSKDLDVICPIDQKQDVLDRFPGFKIDFSTPEFLGNGAIAEIYRDKTLKGLDVVSMTGLAVFKRSHAWRKSPKNGYHALHEYTNEFKPFMTDVGHQIAEHRQKLTINHFKELKLSLNMSNEEFFTEQVTRDIEHDELHRLVCKKAGYTQPMHQRLKFTDELDNAHCKYKLWAEMDAENQLKCVWEETTVIALERFSHFSPKRAYYNALCLICTTLTRGWFRDFAIDNFSEIYDMFAENVIEKVRNELS